MPSTGVEDGQDKSRPVVLASVRTATLFLQTAETTRRYRPAERATTRLTTATYGHSRVTATRSHASHWPTKTRSGCSTLGCTPADLNVFRGHASPPPFDPAAPLGQDVSAVSSARTANQLAVLAVASSECTPASDWERTQQSSSTHLSTAINPAEAEKPGRQARLHLLGRASSHRFHLQSRLHYSYM